MVGISIGTEKGYLIDRAVGGVREGERQGEARAAWRVAPLAWRATRNTAALIAIEPAGQRERTSNLERVLDMSFFL